MIDVKALVEKAMDTVFATIPGEVLTTTFNYRTEGGAYDPSTNSYPTTEIAGIQVVSTGFDFREMNSSIIAVRDRKFICKDFGSKPREGDYFTLGSEIWDVIRLFDHPNLFVIHVRRR